MKVGMQKSASPTIKAHAPGDRRVGSDGGAIRDCSASVAIEFSGIGSHEYPIEQSAAPANGRRASRSNRISKAQSAGHRLQPLDADRALT